MSSRAARATLDAMLRAVTFDCWNTLLYESRWEEAHRLRVEALWRAAGEAGAVMERAEAGVAFDTGWERHMRLWERGVASGAAEVAAWSLEALSLAPGGPAMEHLVHDFEEASHSGSVRSLEGSAELLAQLRAHGLRLGLICDTGLTPGRVVRLHLDRLGLLEHLEVTVFSDEWKRTKPDPAVFEGALEALDCDPADAAHVGDLRRTDVAGARGVGMRSVRITARNDDQSAHAEADWVVASHAELLARVESELAAG